MVVAFNKVSGKLRMAMRKIILFIIIQTIFYTQSLFCDHIIPYSEGWPFLVGEYHNLSPAIIDDLDFDGEKEIVVADKYDSSIYMFNKEGTAISGWPVNISNYSMASIMTPAIGNIDDTEDKEIIAVCLEPNFDYQTPIAYNSSELKIFALDKDGRILDGWPFEMENVRYVTTPVLANTAYGSDMEIIFGIVKILNTEGQGAGDGSQSLFWNIKISIYILHYYKNWSDPTTDFYINNEVRIKSSFSVDTQIISTMPVPIISPIAAGDVTGDGIPEIAFSIQGETAYVISTRGTMSVLPGWPKEGGTPIMVDIDKDGKKEIILGNTLQAFNGNGTEVSGYNPFNNSFSGFGHTSYGDPCAGDLDNDGKLEIVAEGKCVGGYGGHGGGFPQISIYVLNHDGTLRERIDRLNSSYNPSQDILADLNNDGFEEIISDGKIYSLESNINYENLILNYTGSPNTATVSCLFGDGSLSLVLTTDSGYIYVYDFSELNKHSGIIARADWPASRHDSSHTGVSDLTTVNNPPELSSIGNKTIYEGQKLSFMLNASDPDNDTITYNARNMPAGAFLNQQTGEFIWTPNYLQSGVYNNIIFTAVDEFGAGSSRSISITVINKIVPPPSINMNLIPDKQTYNIREAIELKAFISSQVGIKKIIIDYKVLNTWMRLKTINLYGIKQYTIIEDLIAYKVGDYQIRITAYDTLYSSIPEETHFFSKQIIFSVKKRLNLPPRTRSSF